MHVAVSFAYSRSAITSAVLAFVSTSIDDFAVMLMFFLKANKMITDLQAIKTPDSLINDETAGNDSSDHHSEDSSHENHMILPSSSINFLPLGNVQSSDNESLPSTSVYINRPGYIKVILGQFVGFTIVVLISLCGMGLGLILPKDIIALIGIFPLLMGIYKLYEVIKENHCGSHNTVPSPNTTINTGNMTNEASISLSSSTYSAVHTCSTDGDIEIQTQYAIDEVEILEKRQTNITVEDVKYEESNVHEPLDFDDLEIDENSCFYKFSQTFLRPCCDPFVLEVATLALICSTDNISIYIALFASSDIEEVFIIIAVFYALLFINVFFALGVMSCPQISNLFQKYSDYLIPFFLVGLGLDILSDSIIWP